MVKAAPVVGSLSRYQSPKICCLLSSVVCVDSSVIVTYVPTSYHATKDVSQPVECFVTAVAADGESVQRK